MKTAPMVLEGVTPDEITESFLVSLLELSEEHNLDAAGISIEWGREGDK